MDTLDIASLATFQIIQYNKSSKTEHFYTATDRIDK